VSISPKIKALLFSGFLVWLTLAWINLFSYSLPWMDTWCYLAPAASCSSLFHLRTPLLEGFLGSDQGWGLHFPGAPLLYSCVFSIVTFRPYVAVLMFIILWFALAILVGWSAYQLTREGFWAIVAGVMILVDHTLFEDAQAQRPEIVGALALVLVWMALSDIRPFHGRIRLVCLAGTFFMLPLLHPVTLAVGACICLLLCWQYWASERNGRTVLLTSILGYGGGGLALFLWFYLQPEAWTQFLDHAVSNKVAYSFGRTFWQALQHFYFPTLTGHLLWVIGLFVSVSTLFLWARGRQKAAPGGFWASVILISGLVAHQNFHNLFYLALYLPAAIVLSTLLLFRIHQTASSVRVRRWIQYLTCLFVAGHGLFWATRTFKYLRDGMPYIRGELAQIAQSLPKKGRILIPEALWEDAILEPNRFAMNTLPNSSSSERRILYETFVYRKLVKGDLVIIDRFQIKKPMNVLRPGEWTAMGNYKDVVPGRLEWGYDFEVWRKN